MDYSIMKDLIQLLEDFEADSGFGSIYNKDITGFKKWIADSSDNHTVAEPDWEGKDAGRGPDSVINTLIVHMNRYARSYSKSAIHGSDFATQEEFIYLINLIASGPMSKMELIKHNIQEKTSGMKIINRLIHQGWVEQQDSETDKRSKIVQITASGRQALEQQMSQIRLATRIVTGPLSHTEKMDLIRLLYKLDHFHKPIYLENIDSNELIKRVTAEFLTEN